MDIEIEDVVFVFLFLIVFALFFAFLLKYDSALPSLAILWIGLTLLLVGHSYIYLKKKRDMRILKYHFFFLVIPAYIWMIYLSYREILDYELELSKNQNLLISGGVLLYIILIAVGEYFLKRKK